MQLSGRTVLLTGATGGIGQAIAERAHAAGARLTLTGRRTDVLEPLAARLGAEVVAADLADRDAVSALAERCANVDALIANAALPASGPLFDFAPEDVDRALEVNLRAPMTLTRLLGEGMVARGSGHLLYVSSLAGKTTSPGSSVYSATKFGLRGFAQALRTDLEGTGVGVSVVFPGFVRDAGMFHESGTTLPRWVGTSTPREVAEGVIDAIERDRGEVDVAPLSIRVGAAFGAMAPELNRRIQGRLGGRDVADQLASGQRSKRG